MNTNAKLAIGIDLGGTKIEASLIQSDGAILETKRITTPQKKDEIAKNLHDLINELSQNTSIVGVGFSIPGSIDVKTNLLRNAPNSPQINGTTFFNDFAKSCDARCIFENDANCLVLSEEFFGKAKGMKHIVGLIMGTGFGGGVWTHGHLLTGANGLAPELGHSILDVNGRLCLCGNKGCVEAYLSGPSILKRYNDKAQKPLEKTEDVFASANQHPVADEIINETMIFYARFVASVVSLYDPELIVLGGGLSDQSPYYEQHDAIQKHIFGSNVVPQIIQASHGNASGKCGAVVPFFK